MADESAQDHLYKHYGDVELRLVDEPEGGSGMSSAEAVSFLRGLHPVARVKQTLKDAAKKVAGKG